MNCKIVADSSCDISTLDGVCFSSVPLKIITDTAEYIDDSRLDVFKMAEELKAYKGISRSSCPNAQEYKVAFDDGDCDAIFCITITGELSGSYNAARIAMNEFTEEHPDRKCKIINSLSVGPESALIILKLKELIAANKSFDEISSEIDDYVKSTRLIFCLESLNNLAHNGRVSNAVAKIAGLLGIRIIGRASDEGCLELIGKARGKDKALADIMHHMQRDGYCGGGVRIHHCFNTDAANELKTMILSRYADAKIEIAPVGGLCSFYAESGGLLVGFETNI